MKKAFTIIEIIISVTILVMFFVMAISSTIVMTHHMKVNEHKILATFYGEDLMNWIKAERERNWLVFQRKALDPDNDPSTPTPATAPNFCANTPTVRQENLNGLLNTIAVNEAACGFNGISANAETPDTNPKIFRRMASFRARGLNNDQIDVTVTVQWRELGNPYEVVINKSFYFLE